jgi:hypothetical protein
MPVHDWTRVDAGIFHHFHHSWIEEIQRCLNQRLLPPEYYALAEQIAGGLGPDVLTLQKPATHVAQVEEPGGGVAVAEVPPKARFHERAEMDAYAAKAKAVVIRHRSKHQVVAVVEIVSPGTKNSRNELRSFARKATELLQAGIHLLVVDLFPPGPRDPQGIHKAIWDEVMDNEFQLPEDKPLTVASYIGGICPEAFIEPVAVGDALPEMPLFLVPEIYVPVPLDATYSAAWDALPSFWRDVVCGPPVS